MLTIIAISLVWICVKDVGFDRVVQADPLQPPPTKVILVGFEDNTRKFFPMNFGLPITTNFDGKDVVHTVRIAEGSRIVPVSISSIKQAKDYPWETLPIKTEEKKPGKPTGK